MRRELAAMMRLAGPVIIAELGWISMGIVDTVMVRGLGPAAIGAVGTGSTIFMTFMVLGMGIVLALDTFVSQNFGAGRIAECHRWLFAGIQLSAGLSIVLVGLVWLGIDALPYAGLHPAVLALLQPYLAHLVWSAPPLLAYAVFRRYLQAMSVVRPVMIALVSANLINAGANWLFINGHLGFPALGVVGSAYATLTARIYLAGFLFTVILVKERAHPSGLHDVPFVPEIARMWRLVRLGVPAALQIALEVGVFATASALAGRITPLALAANQIVLNVASFFFMVPYGLSSAAAVRVGQAAGRHDDAGVRQAGTAALGLAVLFALTMSVLFAMAPGPFLRVFTTDPALLSESAAVLVIYALIQPFDGVQTVSTGALRGLGDTRTPMILNLVGHWMIGLPIAYTLCFDRGWGVKGLWAGLGLGLILVGVVLLVVWQRRSRPGRLTSARESSTAGGTPYI
jgi:MATE family multidrug resistance protein